MSDTSGTRTRLAVDDTRLAGITTGPFPNSPEGLHPG